MPCGMAFFVYILTNRKHGTLYVGHTDDLSRRLETHRSGAVPGFTKAQGLGRLVYFEQHESREAARKRERRLKHWLRAWKIQLIEDVNPEWRDLSADML